jgi:glutathione synthase/RimK-type ligase-like ATP-grasp enzyme
LSSNLYFVTQEGRGYIDDDRLLVAALAELGSKPEELHWGSSVEFLKPDDVLVIRAIWDYHLRPREFFRWLGEVERIGATVINPIPLLRWNAHKNYLRDLERRNVCMPKTWFYSSAHEFDPKQLSHGADYVLKPTISASAFRTVKGTRESIADAVRSGDYDDFVVQEYIPQIQHGEWSLIFIAGELTHAVKKSPKHGDFRVQKEFGGKATPAPAHAHLAATAHDIVALLPQDPVYARVDLVDADERVYLMEVELIEPELFLEHSPMAVERFAAAIIKAKEIAASVQHRI